MSERWKHQLKIGLFWGSCMTLFSTLFDLRETSFSEQLASWTILIRFVIHTLVGIFFLGYVSWRSHKKKNPIR